MWKIRHIYYYCTNPGYREMFVATRQLYLKMLKDNLELLFGGGRWLKNPTGVIDVAKYGGTRECSVCRSHTFYTSQNGTFCSVCGIRSNNSFRSDKGKKR